MLTTTCLSYVCTNPIDQVINAIIQEKYCKLTYISIHNVSRKAETYIYFAWLLVQMLTFIGT